MENNIFKEIASFRTGFEKLLKKALKDGLVELEKNFDPTRVIYKHYNWPDLSYKSNGLPFLSSTMLGNGPPDYGRLFNRGNFLFPNEDGIDLLALTSCNEFTAYILNNTSLKSRFVSPDWSFGGIESNKINALNEITTRPILNAIDRYAHIYQTFVFEEEKSDEIVHQIANFVFNDTLRIDIYVPILFVLFETDSYEIAPNVLIKRLSESEHLARFGVESHSALVHQTVVSSATHALVLKNWEIENTDLTSNFNVLNNSNAYKIEEINDFFAALRLVGDVSTGYAQVFSISRSWLQYFKAYLPNIMGATIRSYPSSFENYYWTIKDVPTIEIGKLAELAQCYKDLTAAKENSIRIGVARLNRCLIRDNEEDSVLDATIALESLLSDDGNQEMTHKLALRVAALAACDKKFGKSPVEAFSDIKKIYSYRSAIVHGSKTAEKKRMIKIDDNVSIPVQVLALEYLKFVLRYLLQNSKYRNPVLIDQELLLRDSPAK